VNTPGARDHANAGAPPAQAGGPNAAARASTMSLVDAVNAWQAAGPGERGQALSLLLAIARDRHGQLGELMEGNPAELLRIALPPALRAALPPEAAALVEQDADADGELEVLHVDYADASADRYEYALRTAMERLALHFASAPPTHLMSGTHVRARGLRVGNALALDSASALTVAKATALPNTLGAQKTLMMLVNFSDLATQPYSVAQAQSVLATTSNFDYEASYQQTWLTSTVAGWFTIASTSTTCDYNTIASQAQQAASKAGYVLSNYNRYVYVFPGNACGWWGLGTVGGNPSHAWINTRYGFSLTVLGHEMGHNLGLYHAHSLDCGTAPYAASGCSMAEYGDVFDLMGNSGRTPHYNAYQKERLGWLNAGVSPPLLTASSQTGTATYAIAPVEDARDTRPRAVKIPQNDSCTSPQKWLYVESRQATGFDAFLAGNTNVLSGVLVHAVTDGDPNSSNLLDMTPATTAWTDSALVAGLSYVDPVRGVAITPQAAGATGATVAVTMPAASCTHLSPAVALTPASTVWTSAGATVSYTATVTNKDGCGCAASTFDLASALPAGWSASAARTGSIAPGASGAASVLVTAPAAAVAGIYDVTFTAANSVAPTVTGKAAGTVAIAAALADAVSTDRASYTLPAKPNQSTQVTITTKVTSGSTIVSGASVSVQVVNPAGSVTTLSGTTGSTGTVMLTYTLKKKSSRTGTYAVTSTATMGSMKASGTTSFTVQ
jgi:hypothetical protein